MGIEEKIERVMVHMMFETHQETKETYPELKGFENIYLFTNENLNIYLKRLKLKDKRVLTVGSSGDQILYSILNGAKEVVCVDLCPISKYYYDLKVACIKNLSFEQFSLFAYEGRLIYSPSTYKKVSHDIVGESREFWDHLFLEGFSEANQIHRANIRMFEDDTLYQNNPKVFNSLKQKLNKNDVAVNFLTADIRNLPDLLIGDNKFDVMLLSNIAHYSRNWNEEKSRTKGREQFIELVKKLSRFMNKGGVMQIDYAYHDRLDRYETYARALGRKQVSSSAISFMVGPILYRPENKEEGEIEQWN